MSSSASHTCVMHDFKSFSCAVFIRKFRLLHDSYLPILSNCFFWCQVIGHFRLVCRLAQVVCVGIKGNKKVKCLAVLRVSQLLPHLTHPSLNFAYVLTQRLKSSKQFPLASSPAFIQILSLVFIFLTTSHRKPKSLVFFFFEL